MDCTRRINTETLLQFVGLVLGKPKLIWEMKPDREGKVTRKGSCRYGGSRRKAEEHTDLLLHGQTQSQRTWKMQRTQTEA